MKIIASRSLILLLIGSFSCDIVKDEPTPNLKATAFTFANKPAVFNIASISSGRNFVATTQTSPQYGTIETIFDGKYLIYKPNSSFLGQIEKLPVTLSEVGTSNVTNLNIVFRSLDEQPGNCQSLSGIYDYAQIKQGESLTLDLLNNDVFCNIEYNGGIIREVVLEGVQTEDFVLALGPGRLAEFRYTPAPGFTGKIKVIYNLGINWIAGSGHIEVTEEEILTNPKKYLEAFTTALIEIDVVP
jgi:hypothetical protein